MIRIVSAAALAAASVWAAPASAAAFLPWTTAGAAMMTGQNGYSYQALFTVGDVLPNGYEPVGILDGLGAYRLSANTVRVFANHELGGTAGKNYSILDGIGGTVSLTGARISYFDIDVASMGIVNAGQGYDRIYDRAGNIVANPAQISGGLNRLCSGALFEANTFGAGRGLADTTYFAGEETGNGTMYALDAVTNQLHAAPAMGRGAWENATQLDTGTSNKVAFVMSDDSSGAASGPDSGSPMYLYVGEKGAAGDGSFLDRNGLAEGKLYVWVSSEGKTNPSDFNGNGSTSKGSWVEITSFDASKAGTAGYDALGYADAATLRSQASAAGAFRFSRPEDVATNPEDSTLFAMASTGSNRFGGADTWGTVYTFDVEFDANGNPAGAQVKVIYDGNDDASRALRSPDNLTWKDADTLLVQEDRSADWTLDPAQKEAQVVELDLDGSVKQAAVMDRSATQGEIDVDAGELGAWESSGILDVSGLFGKAQGTLFIGDVQAHGLKYQGLVEGGQLFFLSAQGAVPEPQSWALLIAGFGVVGGAMRRRRTALSFA